MIREEPNNLRRSSMPIFEKPPLETLSPVNGRWTPVFLEHGRLEVDDSSVKWIAANGMLEFRQQGTDRSTLR
jgi:hypothetical protein